jgi:hypothetical protein
MVWYSPSSTISTKPATGFCSARRRLRPKKNPFTNRTLHPAPQLFARPPEAVDRGA